MGFAMGVGPLRFSNGCFASKINNLLPLVVHAQRLPLNLNEEQPILVH